MYERYVGRNGDQIEIDTINDLELAQFLEEGTSLVGWGGRVTHKMETLTSFVHSRILIADDLENHGTGQLYYQMYAGGRVPRLGEFVSSGIGKCREMALLLHLMAAQAGIANQLITGYTMINWVRHAWDEFSDGGGLVVADPRYNFVLERDQAYKNEYGGVAELVAFNF